MLKYQKEQNINSTSAFGEKGLKAQKQSKRHCNKIKQSRYYLRNNVGNQTD